MLSAVTQEMARSSHLNVQECWAMYLQHYKAELPMVSMDIGDCVIPMPNPHNIEPLTESEIMNVFVASLLN